MKRKQAGFGLLETLLSMVILSGLVLYGTGLYLDYIERRNAEEYKAHIERVIEALQKYQYHKVTVEHDSPYSPSIWPATLDALMTDYPDGQFWPSCSAADEQNGLCRRPDGVPWSTSTLGYKIDFVGTPSVPKATLTFPLSSSVIDTDDRATWAASLQRLPFITLEANQDLSVQIGDPLMVQIYKEFLQRDGSTELTDSWDVGNQAILNASTITARGTNGKQVRADGGVMKRYSTYIGSSGIYTYKSNFICASGLYQTVKSSFNGVKSPSGYDFLATGEIKTETLVEGAGWRTRLTYKAKQKQRSNSNDKGVWRKKYEGYIDIIYLCVPEL